MVADGSARCDGNVDILGEKNCIDLWTSSHVWNRLGCADWKTVSHWSQVSGPAYQRTCTPLRY